MPATSTALSTKLSTPNAASRYRNAAIWSACGWLARRRHGDAVTGWPRALRASPRPNRRPRGCTPRRAGDRRRDADLRRLARRGAAQRRVPRRRTPGTMCSIHAGASPAACAVPATRSRRSSPPGERTVRLSPILDPGHARARCARAGRSSGARRPGARLGVNMSSAARSKSRDDVRSPPAAHSPSPARARAPRPPGAPRPAPPRAPGAPRRPARRRRRRSTSIADAGLRPRVHRRQHAAAAARTCRACAPTWNTPGGQRQHRQQRAARPRSEVAQSPCASAARSRDHRAVGERDACGDARHRLALVRDDDHRLARRAASVAEQAEDRGAGRRVEVARSARRRASSGGSLASARAIATRCCWPPDSVAGSLSAWSATPTRASRSRARGAGARAGPDAGEVHRQHHVLDHGQRRQELEELEDDADACVRASARARRGRDRRAPSADAHAAGGRAGRCRASMLSSVDLPLPDLPTMATNSPGSISRSIPRSAWNAPAGCG